MDYSFTAEQDRARMTTRSFCEGTIAPRTREIDDKGEIPRDVIGSMAARGLLGLTISKEYGGSGSGFLDAAIVAEEIARADTSMAVAVYYLLAAGWGFLLERHGTKELKDEVLPEVTKGESFLGIASTEAGGGSDIASTSTVLVRKNGSLVVNGAKTYISGVREAAVHGGGFVTVVRTGSGPGHKSLSLSYIPVRDRAGVTVSTSGQMGREGISNGFLSLKDVILPPHYLIGGWDEGFYHALEGFNCARALVSAACIGAAQKALERGIDFLGKRRLFGASLSSFEGIQFQLSEDYLRLESARQMVYKAAWMLDEMYRRGRYGFREVNKAVAAAKLSAPTAAFDIIKDVMMWHGAYGYTKEAGLERALRGVTSYLVGAEGAQNIMRLIIARELLEREDS